MKSTPRKTALLTEFRRGEHIFGGSSEIAREQFQAVADQALKQIEQKH